MQDRVIDETLITVWNIVLNDIKKEIDKYISNINCCDEYKDNIMSLLKDVPFALGAINPDIRQMKIIFKLVDEKWLDCNDAIEIEVKEILLKQLEKRRVESQNQNITGPAMRRVYYNKKSGKDVRVIYFNEKSGEVECIDSKDYWEEFEYDKNGNNIGVRCSYGFWEKREFDKNNNENFRESSNGSWSKWEYDKNSNLIHSEYSETK